MNKRWNHMLLNGRPFIQDMKYPEKAVSTGSYGDICDAYTRPSDRKIRIYNNWWFWFKNHSGACGVSSRNSNFFTISGYVRDENNKLWQCYITPTYNYCYEVIGG